ncbi:hypothetical protein [Lysobacter brunescens]|uniref:Uncharacterized protein n=1 Tax=Lysobacter brunescens TaxID=262323 RepID=A0ABW2YEH5_9GAMM
MPSLLPRVVIVLAAMLLPASSIVAAERIDGASLVGRTLPPYPGGLDELQGSCIAGGPGLAHVCDHSIAVLGHRLSDAERSSVPQWIVASRNIDSGATQARWEVTDAVAVPKPRAGYDLHIGTCRIDGVDAPGVIASVRHRDDEISRDVRWARRYDLATGRLVAVAPGKVDCINEGFGL